MNFDLCFTWHDDDPSLRNLVIDSNAPWKPFLLHDVSLGLWPRILAKMNSWDEKDSHSTLDALLFLVKEKCDMLLQNVRWHKI